VKLKDKLRKRRKWLEIKQSELAERAGVDQTTISNYELGKTRVDAEALAKIAIALGVSTDWLLGLSEDVEWETN